MRRPNIFTAAVILLATLAVADSARAQRFSDWSAPVNLGPVINTASTDGCPYISKDGLSLYFASNRSGGFGNLDLYVSERAGVDEPWGTPQNLGFMINSANADICPTLTIDGHWLYFVSDRPGGCGGQDLYVSRRRDKRDNFGWGEPVNLGCLVNSPQNDFSPSLFEDEDGRLNLYFSSNRPGGPGGVDIYSSILLDEDTLTFGPPTLVPGLNTASDDQRPNVRRDGLEIFFDSNRPGSINNSFDLWTATRESTSDLWLTPVNLGPVVNSTLMEGRPALSFDGTALYFMSNRPDGFGGIDLYLTTRSKLRGPR